MASRLARALRARIDERDEGFTLIEVVVALTIFAMVVSASVGMLIAGSKASLVAKMDTGAKNLGQERLEQLRNLPFHLDHTTTPDADDLLDTYFAAYSATNTTCNSTSPGFVHGGTATASASPSGTDVRCTYFGDPASGDFYRYPVGGAAGSVPGFSHYQQFVTLQFLGSTGASGAALDVPTTYNTQGSPATADIPVSTLVGARVTTLWKVGTLSKRNSVFSLISQSRPAATNVSFSAAGIALEATGRLADGTTLDSQAGLVSADGSATRNTTAATSGQSVFVSVEPGSRINGACALSSSGGTGTACTSPSSSGVSLKDAAGNVLGTFANSGTSGVAQATTNSLPQVGTADASGNPTALVQAFLDGTGSAPDVNGQTIYGVSNVVPASGFAGNPALLMNTGKPLAYIDKPSAATTTLCGNASGPTITGKSVTSTPLLGATYGVTVGGVNHFSSTCVAVQTRGLHLFPTAFAPQGIVLIDFAAQATCRTNGGLYNASTNANGGKGFPTYSGTVQVWNSNTQAWGSAIAFNSSSPLSTAVPTSTPLFAGLTIGSYISSWASASAADLTAGILIDQDNNAVTLKYANLARIDSVVLGSTANSSLGLLLGNIACTAEDNR